MFPIKVNKIKIIILCIIISTLCIVFFSFGLLAGIYFRIPIIHLIILIIFILNGIYLLVNGLFLFPKNIILDSNCITLNYIFRKKILNYEKDDIKYIHSIKRNNKTSISLKLNKFKIINLKYITILNNEVNKDINELNEFLKSQF